MRFINKVLWFCKIILFEIDWWLHHTIFGPIRLWWASLWIRKNEFDSTLEIDWKYVYTLSKSEKDSYYKRLAHLRWIAHEEDLKNSDLEHQRKQKSD